MPPKRKKVSSDQQGQAAPGHPRPDSPAWQREARHRGVEGGCGQGEREGDVADVDEAARLVGAADGHSQGDGGIGGQHPHGPHAEQVVGPPTAAATGPQPEEDGQQHDVDQGEDQRVQLLARRQRRVAHVREHHELPRQQRQPGREHQGVEQRGHVPPAAPGPDELEQGDREQQVGGQIAQVGQVALEALLDEVAKAEEGDAGRHEIPGQPDVGPVAADTEHHRRGGAEVEHGPDLQLQVWQQVEGGDQSEHHGHDGTAPNERLHTVVLGTTAPDFDSLLG
jgi:hypothetical protein